MPHITRHGGPDDLAATEELATERRLEQEAQALNARAQHAERRAGAVRQEEDAVQRGIPTPANAEQERVQAAARAAHAERRRQALAQASVEAYEGLQAPAVGSAPIEGAPDADDGPTAA